MRALLRTTICPPWCHSQSPLATSSHFHTGMRAHRLRTALGFTTAVRQWQMVTQTKSELEWELLLKQAKSCTRNLKDHQARMVMKQEDQ